MRKEKLQKALNLSSSNTVEEFFDELLNMYIDNKEVDDVKKNAVTDYQMVWGGAKLFHANGISENGKYIEILAGSDFASKETRSLGQIYKDVRKDLLDKGIVKMKDEGNYCFVVNHKFPSFSTAASVIRGVQLNGKKYFNPKMD